MSNGESGYSERRWLTGLPWRSFGMSPDTSRRDQPYNQGFPMASSKKTPLQVAMDGGDVSEKQAQSALGDAVSKIASLTRKNNITKEQMEETGEQVVNTGLTQGSLFLSSLAEGYFGPEKMKVGGVDMRAGLGVAATGYGLYQTITGEEGGAGYLAAGNGVFGSWLATVGRDAGQALAEKRNKGKDGAPAASAGPAATQPNTVTPPAEAAPSTGDDGLLPEPRVHRARALPASQPEPVTSGPVREILLTPRAEGGRPRAQQRGGRGGGEGGDRQNNRFIRAAVLSDNDD